MRKYIITVVVIIAAFATQNVQSQSFLEKMAKKAAEKAEKKAEQKTEEEMDKKLDQLFEEAFEDDESQSESDVDMSAKWAEKLAGMGYAGEPVDIDDSYSFSSSITMHIESIDKDGTTSSNGDIKIYTNTDDQTFAYEFISNETESNPDQQKGLIIMDMKNQASIILNDDEKSGIIYGVDGLVDGSMYDESDEEEEDEMPEDMNNLDPRLTKTGNTKTILGYKCDEYKYKDEESEGLVYITQDVDWKSEDFMTTIFKSSMYSNGVFNGFMMASEHVNLNDGEKSTYEVTDINKNDKSAFVMSDYQLTNIGSFKIPEEVEE
ncbi:hypothetical protein [Carboxylicivirga linearis]|uniref:DUF4412 domain-containing protein n=1 Tax=Carboxylicivirga linearis TaxID=1628157 RepID=A0ABS5JQU6_9BACT|nr:hypothetical protein [Carboxylicivirga linearis]MBS2097252.1 hypothetical protein [Carboxylicivirga linearis]